MLLAMIVIGGATRLTGSGLSIMEWEPLLGVVPPRTDAQWSHLFAIYRRISQYRLVNAGFGMDGFRHIFWLEWVHRLWGRVIGLAVIGPLLVFVITGRIQPALARRLLLLLVLGGLQGAVGWFMVMSGFDPDNVTVAPLRLVLHLMSGFALYAAMLWTAYSVRWPDAVLIAASGRLRAVRVLAASTAALIILTVAAGGLTAGLHAGLGYNTFPEMDGRLLPPGYDAQAALWQNMLANVSVVQFDHRVLATLTMMAALSTSMIGLGAQLPRPARRALILLAVVVGLQYVLGVTTLLLHVPVWAGALHQAFAALLLGVTLLVLHRLRASPRVVQPSGRVILGSLLRNAVVSRCFLCSRRAARPPVVESRTLL